MTKIKFNLKRADKFSMNELSNTKRKALKEIDQLAISLDSSDRCNFDLLIHLDELAIKVCEISTSDADVVILLEELQARQNVA